MGLCYSSHWERSQDNEGKSFIRAGIRGGPAQHLQQPPGTQHPARARASATGRTPRQQGSLPAHRTWPHWPGLLIPSSHSTRQGPHGQEHMASWSEPSAVEGLEHLSWTLSCPPPGTTQDDLRPRPVLTKPCELRQSAGCGKRKSLPRPEPYHPSKKRAEKMLSLGSSTALHGATQSSEGAMSQVLTAAPEVGGQP